MRDEKRIILPIESRYYNSKGKEAKKNHLIPRYTLSMMIITILHCIYICVYELSIVTTEFLFKKWYIVVVSEPLTEILGAPDLYINRGSTINLTCVILHSPEPPGYIFWNHDDAVSVYIRMLNICYARFEKCEDR